MLKNLMVVLIMICFMGCTQSIRGLGTPVSLLTLESDNPENGMVVVEIVFGESVKGFDVSDLLVTGASIESFSGSGNRYLVTLNPTDSTYSVQVLSGAAKDTTDRDTSASNILTFQKNDLGPVYGGCYYAGNLWSKYKTLNW